jgi:hypothetical protein
MNRHEFERLRDLPDKRIISDIIFTPSKQVSTTLTFDRVQVLNALDEEILLNGRYKPDIPSLAFNFVIPGVGPICRLEVNATIHKAAGRTHKHGVMKESCPRLNLPFADARLEFDLNTQSPQEIWIIFCRQANITHLGAFIIQ